jgi:SNF2 family DNA or RNA helicase
MRTLGKHLAFKCDDPTEIQMIIPETIVKNGWVAVPHSLQIATMLRSMGYDAPSPILHEYQWTGNFTPFAHQKATAEFLTLNKRAFCLNGMGTGKTLSAIWAADYLQSLGVVNRVLVISPLSTLDVVWGRELFLNQHHRTCAMLHGSSDRRRKLLAEPHDYYIVNHHGIDILKDELRQRDDINLILIDEAAVYRNAQTKMWKALRSIITPDKWVWGMSGSPTPQAPSDAYGLSKLIRPENVPVSFTRFKQETMLQISPFKWVPRRNAQDTVARVLSPSIRFALRDCIDLPETIIQYRHVEMTPEQKKHYAELLKSCVTEAKGIQVTAVNAAVLLSKLIQCACGVIYGPDKQIIKLDFSHRIKEVEEIIDECDEKVIVFVPLTGALHEVKKELERRGHKCGLIEGDTSKAERAKVFDAFQFGSEMKVLLANAQAMAHGVTLTAASTIVWFAPAFSNETYEQANARIVRPGQKNVTNIINLSATAEESRIYEGLQAKTKFLDLVLEIIKKNS